MVDKLLCVLRNNILNCDFYINRIVLDFSSIAGLSDSIFVIRDIQEERIEKVIKKETWFTRPKIDVKYETKSIDYYIKYSGQKYIIDKSDFDGLIDLYDTKIKEKQEKELDDLCNKKK